MTSTAPSPEAFRARFPIFRSKILLNSCSKGALSEDVERAYARYLEAWRTGGSPWEEWVGVLESARATHARFLGCEPDEVALTGCASAAVDAVASALDFTSGRDGVVVGDFEFPTMAHIWLAQRRRGARILRARARGRRLPVSAYEAVVDERTLLVPTTHVCFRNGFRVDVEGVVAAARQAGALCLVDDYQSSGTRPLDVRALGCDFLVSGNLKYLLGSSGLAFLYVRRELVERLEPTVTGWFGQERPFDFDIERLAYHASARRFETGTPPIPSLYAAEAGLRLVLDVGLERIARHVEGLVAETIRRAAERGIDVLTPAAPHERGPLVVLRSTDAAEAVRALDGAGIIVSSRGEGVRVSFHYYNLASDVDALFDVIDGHRDLFATADA